MITFLPRSCSLQTCCICVGLVAMFGVEQVWSLLIEFDVTKWVNLVLILWCFIWSWMDIYEIQISTISTVWHLVVVGYSLWSQRIPPKLQTWIPWGNTGRVRIWPDFDLSASDMENCYLTSGWIYELCAKCWVYGRGRCASRSVKTMVGMS